jgi:hypothetical protein
MSQLSSARKAVKTRPELVKLKTLTVTSFASERLLKIQQA